MGGSKMIEFNKGQTPLFFDEKMGYLEGAEYNGKKISLSSKLWRVETTD